MAVSLVKKGEKTSTIQIMMWHLNKKEPSSPLISPHSPGLLPFLFYRCNLRLKQTNPKCRPFQMSASVEGEPPKIGPPLKTFLRSSLRFIKLSEKTQVRVEKTCLIWVTRKHVLSFCPYRPTRTSINLLRKNKKANKWHP